MFFLLHSRRWERCRLGTTRDPADDRPGDRQQTNPDNLTNNRFVLLQIFSRANNSISFSVSPKSTLVG